MTTDPLCPQQHTHPKHNPNRCIFCKEFAEVREDERGKALGAARTAVAALPWKVAVSFGPIDCDESCEHGPCTCSGVMRPEAWMTGPADVRAAIDALRGKSDG